MTNRDASADHADMFAVRLGVRREIAERLASASMHDPFIRAALELARHHAPAEAFASALLTVCADRNALVEALIAKREVEPVTLLVPADVWERVEDERKRVKT